MSKTKFLSAWGIALALIFAVFACGDDTTESSSGGETINPGEISFSFQRQTNVGPYVTNGKDYTIEFLNLKGTPGYTFSLVKLYCDNKLVQAVPYNEKSCLFTGTWDNLTHGKHTVSFKVEIEKEGQESIEKEITSYEMICFNEMPRPKLKAYLSTAVHAIADNGEEFFDSGETESETQTIPFGIKTASWTASSGQEPDFNLYLSLTLTENLEQSNCTFQLKSCEVHWQSMQADPSDSFSTTLPNPTTPETFVPIYAYATTSIEGEHEGYPFSMESYTISYKIVNNP